MSLEPNTIRRLAVFVVGLVVLALNKKLGFDLTQTDTLSIAGIIAAYLGQSAYREAQTTKAEAVVLAAQAQAEAVGHAAAKEVDDLDAAVALLKTPPK